MIVYMHVVLETRWFVPNVLSLEFVRCIFDWVFRLGYGILCKVQFFWINRHGLCGYACIMNNHRHRELTIFIPLTNLPCLSMPLWRHFQLGKIRVFSPCRSSICLFDSIKTKFYQISLLHYVSWSKKWHNFELGTTLKWLGQVSFNIT